MPPAIPKNTLLRATLSSSLASVRETRVQKAFCIAPSLTGKNDSHGGNYRLHGHLHLGEIWAFFKTLDKTKDIMRGPGQHELHTKLLMRRYRHVPRTGRAEVGSCHMTSWLGTPW
jgi:hypothetical protein